MLLNRLPEISGQTYIDSDGVEIEEVFRGISYMNDDGEMVSLVLFIDSEDNLFSVEESVFNNMYIEKDDPTFEMSFEYPHQ